jgi:hypothetical protein
VLWCPSQNTYFRNLCEREPGLFDCKVLDFAFNGVATWEMRWYAAESISPADSIRLAEGFHRKPILLADTVAELEPCAIAAQPSDVVLFHVYAPNRRNRLVVRAVNASSREQEVRFEPGRRIGRVESLDLRGRPVGSVTLQGSGAGWTHRARPWEIMTFGIGAPE